jgi:hypothetical protein
MGFENEVGMRLETKQKWVPRSAPKPGLWKCESGEVSTLSGVTVFGAFRIPKILSAGVRFGRGFGLSFCVWFSVGLHRFYCNRGRSILDSRVGSRVLLLHSCYTHIRLRSLELSFGFLVSLCCYYIMRGRLFKGRG